MLEVKEEDLDTVEEGVKRYLRNGFNTEKFGAEA